MDPLWQRLAGAYTFVEIATLVCVEACARFALSKCSLTLHDANGRPVITVDSEPIGRAPTDHVLALPVLSSADTIGMITCAAVAAFDDDQRRALEAISVRVSVRFAELGVTACAAHPLSPRQHAVAELAARGFSNGEVASALAISENTVKKRLQEIYRRLDVANRTELARVLHPALDVDVPPGVTRTGSITITRAASR